MSKTHNATCEASKVTAAGVELSGVEIFSEGIGASEGLLIQDENKAFYLANTSGDLKLLLEKLTAALTDLTAALNTLDSKPVGGSGSAPAPAIASQISNITTVTNELTELSEGLK